MNGHGGIVVVAAGRIINRNDALENESVLCESKHVGITTEAVLGIHLRLPVTASVQIQIIKGQVALGTGTHEPCEMPLEHRIAGGGKIAS